ncbi:MULTISPECIES: gephyrin-like molybdotransferase Glp [unclassified Microbulbifer]|uniref:molybdopterin molybdotransferase MoeA n=1 Tax=unclassified Microbulbifer TaxID=2619833 RepID=UPI0027E415C3|nr:MULTISPECIES: gephyrin-like molybdotransferase Glp [unclassified Microbulbifer]
MSKDCCSQPGLMPIEEARRQLVESITPVSGVERVPLANAAGRTLAEPVFAQIDLPSFDNSAMDGYAIRHRDLTDSEPLKLVGKSFAGAPFENPLPSGCAVRIMTGAVIPEGADTVVMQENVEVQGDRIFIRKTVAEGEHIRRRGEDVVTGTELLIPGQQITTAHIALAAAAGTGSIVAVRKPVVALFSTGDELQQPGTPLTAGGIYDSNRIALQSALQQMHVEVLDLGILPDDRQQISDALENVAARADAIITSGGVSVGEADYTREVIESLGEIYLWKIAMKPGKPFAFGRVGDTPLFGLPGNRVSALVTFQQLVIPALAQLRGSTPKPRTSLCARLVSPLKKKPGRVDFQRGFYSRNRRGELEVAAVGHQGSHILSGLANANCFIVLPHSSGDLPAGTLVELTPLESPFA